MMQKHHLNRRVRPKKTTRIGKPYYKTDNLLQRQFKASCPMEVNNRYYLFTIWSFYVVFIFDNGYL